MAKKKEPKTKQRKNRPDLFTKEELISYINKNPLTEFPFVEELWVKSVALAEKDAKNGVQIIDITVSDNNGSKNVKKKTQAFWSDNPVKWYFKQCGLPQWRKRSVAILESREMEQFTTEHQTKISSTVFDENPDDMNTSDELISWINIFVPEDRQYLKKRYVHYYDCYEINDGADKTTLKRILSLEIALHRIDIKRALGQTINIAEEEKLNNQLKNCFENMKWTKKQRNARDELAQNKFTVWIQDASKDEEYTPKKREYSKDEIDFLLETYISSAREMMS